MNAYAKYIRSCLMGLQSSLEYRANFAIGLLSSVFPIVIQYYVWSAIYDGRPGETMFGYTYEQMVAYTVAAALLGRLISAGIEGDIASDIKSGAIQRFLTQPMAYLPYRLSVFAGQKCVYLGITYLLVVAAMIMLRRESAWPETVYSLLAATLVLLLSVALNFFLFYCISLTAFWVIEVAGFFESVRIFALIISGGIFPIEVFGPWIAQALRFLPFPYTIQFPVTVLNGHADPAAVANGLCVQLVWIALLAALSHRLWKSGTKVYTGVGG